MKRPRKPRPVCDGCKAWLSNPELRRGERACLDCRYLRLMIRVELMVAQIRQENILQLTGCLQRVLLKAAPARREGE